MDDSGDVRYAPPQAYLEDRDPGRVSGAPAKRSTRLWAVLVDVAAGVALYFLAAWLVPRNWLGTGSGDWFAFNWRSVVAGLLLFVVLHGYLLAARGQTLGKAVFRIRIVRTDGSRPGFFRLVGVRYGVGTLLNAVPALGQAYGVIDGLFIFQRSRRCLHDLIADTVVVDA